MPVLIINDVIRRKCAEMIARARAKPVSFDKLREAALGDEVTELKLADRPEGWERPASESILICSHYLCAFSIEEQPAGFVRHLSVSVPKAGKTPHVPAMAMIATELFGFKEFPPATRGRLWLEEFEQGHYAVNVAELIEGTERGGHA